MDSSSLTEGPELTRTTSHPLSAVPSPNQSRKGRSAVPDTNNDNVERASISMPPPASKAVSQQYSLRRPSKTSESGLSINSIFHDSSSPDKLRHGIVSDFEFSGDGHSIRPQFNPTHSLILPEAALSSAKSENDADSNRMSFSSLYSLGSNVHSNAKASGPNSVAESEPESMTTTDLKRQS